MKSFQAWHDEQQTKRNADAAAKKRIQDDLRTFGDEVVEYYRQTHHVQAGSASSGGITILDGYNRRMSINSEDGISFSVQYFLNASQPQLVTDTKRYATESDLYIAVAHFIEA